MSVNRLEDIIQALRRAGSSEIEKKIAERAEEEIRDALTETLNAGEDPDGKPWELTKKGARAYKNAASRLKVTASGPRITIEISGPEGYAQNGTKRIPQRRMIPDGGAGTPKVVADALDRAAEAVFKREMGG